MLGSVAEAARLVSTRNIRIIHALPGGEHALPSTAGGAAAGGGGAAGGVGAGTGAGAGGAAGVDGVAGTGAGGIGVTREVAAAAAAGDQVPLFR